MHHSSCLIVGESAPYYPSRKLGKDVAACHLVSSATRLCIPTLLPPEVPQNEHLQKQVHAEMMKRGICALIAKPRTLPTAISSVLFLVSAIPSSLFLSLAQTPPTHLSFGLTGRKVAAKHETLRASAGHPTQPQNLEASSFCNSLSLSPAMLERNCFKALPSLFESIC